jgi:hypothetical protein
MLSIFREKPLLPSSGIRNWTPSLKSKAAYSTEQFLLLYHTIPSHVSEKSILQKRDED